MGLRGVTYMGLCPKPPASPSGDGFIMGLRPEPPASPSGDGFITSGLRPEPPASPSGDPVAPRRACRAALCAAA